MEDDDITDLLDEVERKYCSPKATPTVTARGAVSKETVSVMNHRGNHKPSPLGASYSTPAVVHPSDEDVIDYDITTGDLDKIISEIISEPEIAGARPGRRGRRVGATRSSPAVTGHTSLPEKRCFPVLLAGTTTPLGRSDSLTKRACDQLRCTSCDFHVTCFDNRAWHSRCDSLFFRNHMPDRGKLKANLVSRKGFRAYACQCSWRSVGAEEEVGGRGGGRGDGVRDKALPLKWVCGKH